MARLGGDTKPPEALLHLRHEFEDARPDGAEIMVVKLLMLCRRSPENGAAGLQQVRTLHVEAAIDEKVFLLGTKRHRDMRLRLAEKTHQPFKRL